MGCEKGSSIPTKKVDDVNILSNFKEVYGESLKDAWVRINKLNNQNSNVYGKEKLHLYFYYGLAPWYKNVVDFASVGSFVLALPEENYIVIKNLFGSKVEENEELESMSTILTYFKKRFENCAKILPDKRNLDHLELFKKYGILEMKDKMSLISGQLNSCVDELRKEDNKIIRAEEEIQCLGQVLRLAASFKDTPKESAKCYVLKNPKNQKNRETNKVWVVKEKK
jgi:hypothetical protein